MRRITLLVLFFAALSARLDAQSVATFEDLYLSKADTFYVNYAHPGSDVGFYDGLCYFPCVYDTSSYTVGGTTYIDSFWSYGFAYSNKRDSVTSGYVNQYSSITGSGYQSSKYAVAYGESNYINIIGPAKNKPVDTIMITNSTYAHNSMRDGDAFAKKFGGPHGTDPDWFKVTINGYLFDSGIHKLRYSVDVYLADFRSPDTSKHYILNSWKAVPLDGTKAVDSLTFTLSSSDTGQFGMNTPAFFCVDNIYTNESSASVHNVSSYAAKIYPNPATNSLHISLNDKSVEALVISDMSGKIISSTPVNGSEITINTSSFAPGVYSLQMHGAGNTATVRFVKQ